MIFLQADTIRETGNIIRAFSGLDLVIVALLIISVVLIWKFLPKWIDKKSEIRMLEINTQNKKMEIETNTLVKNLSSNMKDFISEFRNSTYNKNVLKSIIYNENIPVLERLECFNEYLKIGGNGNCRKFAEKMILENRKLWESILNKEDIEINNLDKYYQSQIQRIDKEILN